MKFNTPLEQPLSEGFSLIVTAAWLNPKGLSFAEIHLYNGTLVHSDTLCLSNHTARGKFTSSVMKRASVEAGEIEQALLLIGGNLTTTLAKELESDSADSSKPTQATVLVELASDAEFFHDPNDYSYATIQVGSHKETWRIKMGGFRNWLLQRFYKETGGTANAQALQDALAVLHAKALYDGPKLPVFLRVAHYENNIYIDLCNEKWEAVEISATGWRVVADPPVKFKRTPGMLPLPYPVSGGSIDELRPFINVGSDSDWILLCSCLIQAIRPVGPYPIQVFHGEQGSSKSTAQSMLRSLIGPNISPLRTEPRNEHDLIIGASNSWSVCLDNLSHISPALSDGLCRLSTGGGFATRQLYSDSDEILFNVQRPVFLNGIQEIVTREDLLDRAVISYLPGIPEDRRRPVSELIADFNDKSPCILGALYDATSVALGNLSSVNLARLPRMADFAKWATAAEEGFGFKPGAFIEAYTKNRRSANDLVLEASDVASAIHSFVEEEKVWEGTATELFNCINERAGEAIRRQRERQRSWPKNGQALSNALRRLAPNLRAAGIAIEFNVREGHSRRRIMRIEWVGNSASAASADSEDQEVPHLGADADSGCGRKPGSQQ